MRLLCVLLLVSCARPAIPQVNDFPQLLESAREKNRSGEWSAAGAIWEQVVARNPVNGSYWSQLAQAWYEAKEYRKAIPAYEKTLELRDGFPFISAYNVACCYARLGEKSPAMEWVERAWKLGFRDLEHARKDDDLTSLHDIPRFRELTAMVDVSKMSRSQGWRFDLQLLWRELKRVHYDLRRRTDLREFETIVKRVDSDIPKLTDNQIMARFMQLARMAGDGHTGIRPPSANRPGLPIQPYRFAEGVFITAAAPGNEDLVGAQILKVGDRDVESLTKELESVVSRDNDTGLLAIPPQLIRRTALLNGLNLIPDAGHAALTVRDSTGQTRQVTLKAVTGEPSDSWAALSKASTKPLPLYLKNRKDPYWFEYLPESKTVFFQYNAVRQDPKQSLDSFCNQLFKFIDEHDVQKLVIDLRWNGGGNTFFNRPIIHGLIKCEKINKKGRLFVVIGRQTFSAAQNCATFIERNTNAIFVGEPSGSSPNFVGETVRIVLPYSKMEGSISDLYWQSSWPMDYRT